MHAYIYGHIIISRVNEPGKRILSVLFDTNLYGIQNIDIRGPGLLVTVNDRDKLAFKLDEIEALER